LFPGNFAENGEGLQVLHYEVGQKFDPHFDTSEDGYTAKNGDPRQTTFLMYLYVLIIKLFSIDIYEYGSLVINLESVLFHA